MIVIFLINTCLYLLWLFYFDWCVYIQWKKYFQFFKKWQGIVFICPTFSIVAYFWVYKKSNIFKIYLCNIILLMKIWKIYQFHFSPKFHTFFRVPIHLDKNWLNLIRIMTYDDHHFNHTKTIVNFFLDKFIYIFFKPINLIDQ